MTQRKKNAIMMSSKKIILSIINTIMLLYTFCVVYTIIRSNIFKAIPYDDCGISDFMINYQGGFVRRGIIGEIIFQINNHIHINIHYFVILLSGISLLLITIYLIKKFQQNNLCWWILPLNICLSGAFFLRKDYFCMGLIGIALHIYSEMSHHYLRMILINLIICFTLCVHESTFFIIAPFIIWMTIADKRTYKIKMSYKLISIMPIVIIFLLLSYFKGNHETSIAIHNSWNISEMGDTPTATIKSLGNSTTQFILFHLKSNFLSQSYGLYGWLTKPLLWFLTFMLLPTIIFLHQDKYSHSTRIKIFTFLQIQAFQFISLFPMLTILSCDQSRIFYYWTVSSILIYTIVEKKELRKLLPYHLRKITYKTTQLLLLPSCRYVFLTLLLFICITPVGTDIYSAGRQSVIGRLALETYVRYTQILSILQK